MKKIYKLKYVLIGTLTLLLWKWSTCLVVELSELNYQLTEKILRFTVLGGILLMLAIVGIGLVKIKE